MKTDFDKEMDYLLRKMARSGEAAFGTPENPKSKIQNPKSAHVDADEISLFAENALPAKSRARMTEHLADCPRCRKILSHLIALNSEAESEALPAKEFVGASAAIPWYKKLFAFPQIAYAMGALALVFSGVIALVVLQNSGGSLNTSVAQRETAPEKSDEVITANSNAATSAETSAMSNTTAGTTGNTTSNAAMSAANTSTNSLARTTTAPLSGAANSNAAVAARDEKLLEEKPIGEQQAGNAKETKTEPMADLALVKPAPPVKRESVSKDGPPTANTENEYRLDRKETPASTPRQQTETTQGLSVQNQISIMPGSQNARRNAPAASPQTARSTAAETADKTGTAKNKSAETRTAGGKVFRRADGVWYDPAYKGGPTVNIRRGTAEYKKLDPPLRSIADSIGGTVVVVWKNKAYRIQ